MTDRIALVALIEDGAPGGNVAAFPLPESYRAAVVRRNGQTMLEGLPSSGKTHARALHVDEVALPQLAPDQAVIAVMASAINFNTVWSAIFEPLPTFAFLRRRAGPGGQARGGLRC